MPSKAQRAAARQAKLRQKKKRGKGSSQVFDAGPTESTQSVQEPVAEVEAEAQAETAPVPTAAPAPDRASARASRRSRQPAVAEVAPSYGYLGSEVRRIGVIAVGIAAIIFALTFVMGT